jgi:hypothetical protein
MFKSLRNRLAERKRRRYEKYAEKRGWVDPAVLERLRQQQSPTRRGGTRRA